MTVMSCDKFFWPYVHNAAFHQGLHCLLKQNRSSYNEIQYFLLNSNPWPLNTYNGPA